MILSVQDAQPGRTVRRIFGGWLAALIRNSSVLYAGSLFASMFAIAALAVSARALGPDALGTLVLIATYVLIVDNLVNFQSWHGIVKYGASIRSPGYESEYGSLLTVGFSIDAVTAIVGTVLAVTGILVLGRWFAWSEATVLLAALYSLTILSHVSGTPLAVLRLAGRFDLLAWQEVFAAAIKLMGVCIAWLAGAQLGGFLAAWAIADVVGRFLLVVLALREISVQGVRLSGLRSSLSVVQRFGGFWSFLWTTNIHSSVKLAIKECDVLVVGWILGPAGAGYYRIIKQAGSVVGKPMALMSQVAFPDLAKAAHDGRIDSLKTMLVRATALSAAAGVVVFGVFLWTGAWLIEAVLGSPYLVIFEPMLIFLVGVTIAMGSFCFHPTLLALGRPKSSLQILLMSSLVHILLLFPLVSAIGLLGAAAAYVVFYAVWATLMAGSISRHMHEASCDSTRQV